MIVEMHAVPAAGSVPEPTAAAHLGPARSQGGPMR